VKITANPHNNTHSVTKMTGIQNACYPKIAIQMLIRPHAWVV